MTDATAPRAHFDRDRAARALAVGFALLCTVHLGALLTDLGRVADVTKPALMPTLAAVVLSYGGARLLVAALLCGCGGDTFLQIGGDTPFLLGMGCFAAGHICYLVLFSRCVRPRAHPVVAAGYATVWLALVALLWPDLPSGLRVPVAVYSLLLTAMAFSALRAGPRSAAGGALFLLSDTLIATDIAEWPQLPAAGFWIMLTYVAAQYGLAQGLLRAGVARGAGNGAPQTQEAGTGNTAV